MRMSKSLRAWLLTAAGAVIIASGVCLLRSGSLDGSLFALLQVLSDGCFMAGAVYICAYLLMRIARAGGFDLSGYLGHAMAQRIRRRRDIGKPAPDYFAYRAEREETRNARQPSPVLRMLLWVGGIFLLLSVLLVGGYFLAG